ncbi:SGNH/GDSL hydrolase family protein [Actinokineospora sp.]|uniref:SGNH/GDSL hydrolase family protein n=1 Tax=Actinokineospora sp. TaxID=1872133 RepID=UPI0040383A0C
MRPTALALTLALLLATLAAPATASSRRHTHYVALGDSYASGPGIPAQTGLPLGCARSDHNYPALVAQWLRTVSFTDVSCGGATTVHMTGPQQVAGGTNPPQLDALRKETDLVTLTIGGNDFGFGEILGTCGRLAAADPTGDPCRRHYTQGGQDVLASRMDAVAVKVATVLAEIKKRSPRATVLMVGTSRILPNDAGCFPSVPFAAGDTPHFADVQRELNRTFARTAHAAGVRFVDPYPLSLGRDACQPPEDRWIEPLQPASPAAPIHPNAKGMRAIAGLTWLTALLSR